VPQDYAEAVRWYRKAAEQGLTAAQQILGAMYDVGKGTQKNAGEAVHWYREAAESGDPIAQYILGVMYQTGDGVPQDYVQAYVWLDRAARQELEQARRSRDAAAAAMTGEQLAEAKRLSGQSVSR
jgi:TPR repeat protein